MTKNLIKYISGLYMVITTITINSVNASAQVIGQGQADKIKTAFIDTVVYWGNIIGLIVIAVIIVKEVYQSAFAKVKNDLVGDILKQVGITMIILALLNLLGNSTFATQIVDTFKGIVEQLFKSII